VRPTHRTILLAAAVAFLAACYLLTFHPFSRPVVLDPATWDYMSLAWLDGYVPYRDIFLHKTPGAMFIGGAGGALARAAGLPPLRGVHAAFIALGAIGAALTFALCRRHGVRPLVAFAASVLLLGIDQWSLAAIEGARPKVATTALGLAGLLVAGRRPLFGGALAGAATLCWQPGMVFGLGGIVEIYRTQTRTTDRWRAIGWFCAGGILPFGILLLYLAATGGLRAFIEQAFVFNVSYIELHARTPTETVRRLWQLSKQWNATELVLLPAAVGGLIAARRSPPVGLTVATVAYALLLFISVQAWPDTILLAPGIAAILAQGMTAILGLSMRERLAAGIVTAAAVANLAAPGSSRFFPPIDWVQQGQFMATLGSDLEPEDTVYVVSCPEFLVHTGRHSVLPWPYMWFGVDRFAAEHTDGGFEQILQHLTDADPKLMLVCRRWNGDLRRRFEEWARHRYQRRSVRYYPHTKRPMMVYRRVNAQ
jgi:hypothetical protein